MIETLFWIFITGLLAGMVWTVRVSFRNEISRDEGYLLFFYGTLFTLISATLIFIGADNDNPSILSFLPLLVGVLGGTAGLFLIEYIKKLTRKH